MAAAGKNSFSFLSLVELCVVLILTIGASPSSGVTTSTVTTSDIVSLSPADTTITTTVTDASSDPTSSTSTESTSQPPTSTSTETTSQPPTYTSTESTSQPPTYTSTESTSQPPTYTSTESTSQPPTSTSTESTSQPPTYTSTESTSQPPTYTSTESTSQPPTYTSTESTSQSPTYTSTESTSQPPTYTSTESTSQPPTYTSTESTSQAPTYTSTESTSQPPTYTSTESTSQSPTYTSTESTSQPPTYTSTESTSQPPNYTSTESTSQPPTYTSTYTSSELTTTSIITDSTSDSTTTFTTPDTTSEFTTFRTTDTTSELTTFRTTDTTSELTTSTSTVATTKAPPPIKFENISMVVTLNVRETQNKVLDTIVCVNYTGAPSSQVKVNLASVEPRAGTCAQCFQILPCLVTDWCLKFIPRIGTLNIARDPVYSLSITCETADGYRISRLVEVRLTTNSPPVFNFTGLFASYTVHNTRNIKNGATIYSVNASDYDGDPLRYTMTVSPDNGNFQIGESDGVIRATNDLSRECSQLVTFYVYVTDNINSPVGPLVISTALNDSNVAPSIINMGELIQVPEDRQAGTIYSIDTRDEQISTIRYTLTVVPSQASSFFNIVGHDIKLTSQLDYENLPGGYIRMTLTARAFDAEGCSSGIRTLTVEVTDRNEPPVVVPNSWTTTVYEGLIDFTPLWRIQDPDANDVAFFNFSTARSNFYIDRLTGAISSIGEYDLDSRKMPIETVTLPIMVTDRGGKTGTATVTVNILDANDNAPVLSSPARSCPVEECKPVGTIICTLTASDADSSFQQNNVKYFGSQSSTFFELLNTGEVVLTSPIRNGDYSSATVVAHDQGQYPRPLDSKPGFVTVLGTPCATTTTTTKTTSTTSTSTSTTTGTSTTVSTTAGNTVKYNFMAENLPWMMVSALLGTCFVALLGFMACRYARPVCAKESPERFSLVKSNQPTTTRVEMRPHSNNVGPVKHSTPVVRGSEPPSFNFWSTMTKAD